MASQHSERTPLTGGVPAPKYVFQTNFIPRRAPHWRQFQGCFCILLMVLMLIVLMLTVSYTSKEVPPEQPNATDDALSQDSFLLALTFPLDAERKNSSGDIQWILMDGDWSKVVAIGAEALQNRDFFEGNVTLSELDEDSASYRHQRAIATSAKASNLSRAGYAEDHISRRLVPRKGYGPLRPATFACDDDHQIFQAPWFPQERRPICGNATSHTKCNATRYRSYDGTCNNLAHPLSWGAAMTGFRRLLPPSYADGVSAPRSGLPSARKVSLLVHRSRHRADANFTVVLAVWGQFLDHDITATALSRGANGTAISCCTGSQRHPECFPVPLDEDDPYRTRYNITCMEFVRSAPAPSCCLGPREQLNQVSAYIDGSVIYGADQQAAQGLRSLQGGRLKMYSTEDNRTLLPVSEDLHDGCNRAAMNARGKYCFATGDGRANENLHLTTMHLLWARHHNAIADELGQLNRHWADERLYQEARRIVAAQMQHITYTEFLPLLLGPKLMQQLDLAPKSEGYSRSYKDDVDASIANGFASSAFRFAHTLIPGLVKMLGNDNSSAEYIQLHKMLFDPYRLYAAGELERALRGAADTGLERDGSHADELQQHLFERRGPGLDLVSLNIQRGRDHGLPPYPTWRRLCGQTAARAFSDLRPHLEPAALAEIQALYAAPEDVDAYTGMLSERPRAGAYLGPTLSCLLADQFFRLKHGDRFWYETPEQPQAFDQHQLRELRKTTLADVFCRNADTLDRVQPRVMEKVGTGNRNTACGQLQRPSLEPWREQLPRTKLASEMSVLVAN